MSLPTVFPVDQPVEIRKSRQPSGLIANLIKSNRKIDIFIIILIVFLFFLNGILGYFMSKSDKLFIDRLDSISNHIYDISICFCLLKLLYERSSLRLFIQNLDKLILPILRVSVNKYIDRRKKILRIYTWVSILYEIFCILFNDSAYSIIKIMAINDANGIKIIGLMIFKLIYCLCWVCYHIFLAEISIHSQSVFAGIIENISSLNKSDHNLINHIKYARLTYFEAGELIRLLDSYLIFSISSLYIYMTGAWHVNFVSIFDKSSPLFLHLIFFSGESFHLVFLTYQLVYINWLSTRVYLQVYQLSFSVSTFEGINEVNLFLERISCRDIGFTFCKVFVITPNFVSSLATISLTIALAVPSLTKIV